MKKEIKNQKTEFSITKINRIISKINKTGLILIVAVYVAILSFALSTVGKDISYINEPNYEHQFYNKEISPQITVVGVREFDDDHGHEHTKYNVSVNIAGRQIDSKDPNYKINSFRMFANTKKEISDKELSGTHYFTEHTTYSTPITHSFTMDAEHGDGNPSTFYVRLQYDKDGTEKIATFKEDVFLQPTSDDEDGMSDWYLINTEKSPSAANIFGVNDQTKPVGVIELQAYKDTDEEGKYTGKYLAGVRISVDESINEKFHIDMQSWIVTEDGEFLPFIGVYNYTGVSKRFTNSGKEIDTKLKPKYLAAKVVYRDETNKTEYTSYIKQEITELRETFSSNQEVGINGDAGNVTTDLRSLYIGIIIASVISLTAIIFACSYTYLKKQEKKNLKK